MDTETPGNPSRHGASAFTIFVTSISAAIVVGGGLGIVTAAFVLALANLFGLGHTFVWVGLIATALATLWLSAWTFARSLHVERRLKEGLEIDDPKWSIIANLRGS
jgi:hypothetical protein